MKLVLKIILCLIVLVATVAPGALLFNLLWDQDRSFEPEMLILFGLVVLGICSLVYHIKTVQLYKLWEKNRIFSKPDSMLWGLNLGYAGALILWSLFIVYVIFVRNGSTIRGEEALIAFIVIGLPVLLGILLLAEAYFINQKLEQNKARKVLLEIDDIKGDTN